MTTASASAKAASLEGLWAQWTVVVDLFARKELARRQVRSEDYHALHQKLLEACNDGSTDARIENFARQAAEVARPWRNVESLNDAPVKILEDLWKSCQSVNQETHGSVKAMPNMKWSSAAVFVTVVVVVFFGTLIAMGPGRGSGGTGNILGRWSEIQYTVKSFMAANEGRLHLWTLGTIGGTAATIMAYCVFRSPRRT